MSRIIILFSMFFSLANASLFDFYYFNKAKKAYEEKNYKKAQKYIYKIDADNDYINYDIANISYKVKDYAQAIKYYKRAYGKRVNEADRLFNLGNSYLMFGEFDNAILTYQKALNFSNDEDILKNLKLAKLLKTKAKKESAKKNKKDKEGKKKLNKNKIGKKIHKKHKSKLSKELQKMLKANLRDKKLPVLMYQINSGKTKNNPW